MNIKKERFGHRNYCFGIEFLRLRDWKSNGYVNRIVVNILLFKVAYKVEIIKWFDQKVS